MRILLAEDNVVNQRVALRILEKAGHSVVLARDGAKAVEKFNGQRFDMVLMEVQMPEMSGIEATATIRKMEAGLRTPIIALTAHAMRGDQQRCLDAGMDDYLAKPIHASASGLTVATGVWSATRIKGNPASANHGGGSGPDTAL
jgi:CheY-like chemotaxis protein